MIAAKFGSWEPGLLPLEAMSDQRNYEVLEAVANELGSPLLYAKRQSRVVHNTYHLPAVQHTHLEPHISISWMEGETLVVRSSTQVPFHVTARSTKSANSGIQSQARRRLWQ
jgi:hypothetical protein